MLALAYGIFCKIGSVFNVQLSHYVSSVMIHSAYAYEKKIGDDFVVGEDYVVWVVLLIK